MTNQDKVREFHRAFGLPVRSEPGAPSLNRVGLRRSLLREESDEALVEFYNIAKHQTSGFARDDDGEMMEYVAALAKELADVLVVTYGAAAEFGIDLDAVMDEVHRSNMSKLGADGQPIYRESDGKVLKGPDYSEADVASILARYKPQDGLF